MNRCVSITCAVALSLSLLARADSPPPCAALDTTDPDWDIYSKVAISKMCERYPEDCADMRATFVCTDRTNAGVDIEVRGEPRWHVGINRATKEISSVSL